MTNFATDASTALSAPRRAGPLIAIASGKGGVGKTTLAIAMAHAGAIERTTADIEARIEQAVTNWLAQPREDDAALTPDQAALGGQASA